MGIELGYSDILRRRAMIKTIPDRLLCLDPGDVTGIAVFEHGYLSPNFFDETGRGQMTTTNPDVGRKLEELFDVVRPTHVVCEAYRVYANKVKEHINSDIPTLRLIGRIEHICEMRRIPITLQLATEGKSFATDAMLDKWKISRENENLSFRHSKDAVRHGIHYILFK